MWHAPPLEDWPSVEAAVRAQEQADAETKAQLARQARESERAAGGKADGGDEAEGVEMTPTEKSIMLRELLRKRKQQSQWR